MSAEDAEKQQMKKDQNTRRVKSLESRLNRVNDLAISLSDPGPARVELGLIMSDPHAYAAVMINHHLYNLAIEAQNAILRKMQERHAMMEEMEKRKRAVVR
ncbi:MAG: hypothetical protein QXI64_10390 [Sulfolobales archaeon]